MNILFIHQNFPGQFKHLAPALLARGHKVTVLTPSDRPVPAGVALVRYAIDRGNTPELHPWLLDTESKVIRGQAAYRAALNLKANGYAPDLIVAHPGWGESLFLKTVWPKTKLLAYCEYFYGASGSEVNFDPEFASSDTDMLCQVQLKNINNLLHLQLMDQGITPTRWQQQSYPKAVRNKIAVIHDGIDTQLVKPNVDSWLQLQAVRLSKEDEVITFVSRNLEPTRGFHIWMRALPELLEKRPNARILIVGGDEVSYGAKAPNHISWRQHLLAELTKEHGLQLDVSRVHFLGKLPYAHYLALLQISTVHVYLTYPFILSWSLLEAMACECAIVASKTAPVQEVIQDNKNGMLVDFFSKEDLISAVDRLLDDAPLRARLGKSARQHIVKEYDLHTVCLPQQIKLLEQCARS